MNLSENQYEVIEAYLTGELSAADAALFEADMRTNPDLRAEVDQQRDLRLGLRALGIERALARAKAQYQATSSPVAAETEERLTADSARQSLVRPLVNWRYWAAAASIAVVLGVGYFTYQQTADQRADLAYAETFAPDQTEQLMKDFPSGQVSSYTRTAWLDALAKYRAGKYDQVISQLRTLPADKQTIHYKHYLLGLSYLANKQPTPAIPLLSKARATPDPKLRQKADWFLALAYVKNGQTDKALPTLKRISTDRANPFYPLAQRVLQKID